MNFRTFRPGDEPKQVHIYNTAAATLPKLKVASVTDVQRRTQNKDFDPTTRWYAEEQGKVVGYCAYQVNGRIGYPWRLPGFESAATPLFERTLQSMKERGITKAFAAYRKDWPTITGFFENHGFKQVREMVNFVMAFENMPTAIRLSSAVTPATLEDIPAIFDLDPTVFRVPNAEALKQALWNNPWIKPAESIFVLRNREGAPQAAGIFITGNQYADPRVVDADMPCFRLGAFGAEGMTTKRLKGMFSFVTRPDRTVFSSGMELLSYASMRIGDEDDITSYAGQVASDAEALFLFYQRHFERQGSFPVFERSI